MKVICIDATTPNKSGKRPEELIEGNTYTVTGEEVSPTGIEHYLLLETIFDGYGKFRFIPLSTIDETQLEEQRLQTA